jgi:proteasome beta subunit
MDNYKMDTELKNMIMKSGTTILSIVCKDGLVMGADRRATAGNIVMSKNEQKVRKINDYLVLAGCGTASDIFLSEKVISAELRLKELKTKSRPSVKEAANLIGMMYYKNIRSPSMIPHTVGTLVGGVNDDGTVEAYTIEPAGGVYTVKKYDANFGSGMTFVLGLLERQWKENMTIDQGVELAIESLKSSTQRDTASGNGIDIFTLTKDGIKHVVSQEITPTYN